MSSRPNGRCDTARLVAVLALLLMATAVWAQDAPLDRLVGPDHLGAPIVWAPDAIGTGLWARRVAQGARVAVVFEAAPPRPSSGLPTAVDLTGLTVRAALDRVVESDPRYAWHQIGDAVVVRPIGAWEDAEHPLQAAAGAEQADDQPLAEAIRQVLRGAPLPPEMAALTARVDRGARVVRTATPGTALARLSALAALGEVFVQVWDPRATTGPIADVASWDGHSYPIHAGQPQQETAP